MLFCFRHASPVSPAHFQHRRARIASASAASCAGFVSERPLPASATSLPILPAVRDNIKFLMPVGGYLGSTPSRQWWRYIAAISPDAAATIWTNPRSRYQIFFAFAGRYSRMVDFYRRDNHVFLRQSERCPPLRHHLTGLFGSGIKHTHFAPSFANCINRRGQCLPAAHPPRLPEFPPPPSVALCGQRQDIVTHLREMLLSSGKK